MHSVANLEQEFAKINEHWSPNVVADVNGHYVKVAKLLGELVWHKHDNEDELFYIVKGALEMQYENGVSVELKTGDVHVVPRNTMHNPIAREECWIVLVEPAATKHTGDVESDLTKSVADQVANAPRGSSEFH
ncbi:MAG: cupin domain-containing protein [Alphaproteobacteria bacterium]|nr:cupin domain-containing protein [Alphaproteobacteria bacterium]